MRINTSSKSTMSNTSTSTSAKCKLGNCQRQGYNGYDFCGRNHKNLSNQLPLCKSCRQTKVTCRVESVAPFTVTNESYCYKCIQAYKAKKVKKCSRPVCNELAYVDKSGKVSSFCSHTCRLNLCVICKKNDRFKGSMTCSRTCQANLNPVRSTIRSSPKKSVSSGNIKHLGVSDDTCEAFKEYLKNGKSNLGKKFLKAIPQLNNQKCFGFYSKNSYGEFYLFCNFFKVAKGITLEIDSNSYEFTNVEAAYQASKFLITSDTKSAKKFYNRFKNLNGYDAWKLAKDIGVKVPQIFHNKNSTHNKFNIMKSLVFQKFDYAVNPKFAKFLAATGSTPLKEVTTTDTTWGIGTNGTGDNLLGKYLEEKRAELQKYFKDNIIAY